MTGFKYNNVDDKSIGDKWKETVLDPIHGRDDVPKSYKRNGCRLAVVKAGSEIKRVTIHPKTTENAEEWATSDAWLDAEACR